MSHCQSSPPPPHEILSDALWKEHRQDMAACAAFLLRHNLDSSITERLFTAPDDISSIAGLPPARVASQHKYAGYISMASNAVAKLDPDEGDELLDEIKGYPIPHPKLEQPELTRRLLMRQTAKWHFAIEKAIKNSR